MRSETWLGRLWARLWAGVIQDVPASLEECESCREVSCTEERWETCEKRLATEAASLAALGSSCGQTFELLPRVSSSRLPLAERERAAESEPPRTRKMSPH